MDEDRITRPDGPEILRQLWEYLGESRRLHDKLEALHRSLSAELEDRSQQRVVLADVVQRVGELERASSVPPGVA